MELFIDCFISQPGKGKLFPMLKRRQVPAKTPGTTTSRFFPGMQDGFRGSSSVGAGWGVCGAPAWGAQLSLRDRVQSCPVPICIAMRLQQLMALPRLCCLRCLCSVLGRIARTRSGGENSTRGLKKHNPFYGGTLLCSGKELCLSFQRSSRVSGEPVTGALSAVKKQLFPTQNKYRSFLSPR